MKLIIKMTVIFLFFSSAVFASETTMVRCKGGNLEEAENSAVAFVMFENGVLKLYELNQKHEEVLVKEYSRDHNCIVEGNILHTR